MSNYLNMKVLLIGSGYMAKEYAKVLESLKISYTVIGRSQEGCNLFKESYPNAEVLAGGIESFDQFQKYTHAIVCSNVNYLAEHTLVLLKNGITNVLVEKPAGLNELEIKNVSEKANQLNAKVFVAYNRRFFSSVIKCKELIKEDDGVLSFNFEFTEWPHTFENIPNYEVVKNNLLFANSTHVIDLAFFIGGLPVKMSSFATDKLDWHPKAIYAGAGITNNNVLFNYQANWKAPGRWVVEVLTAKRRFIFKPMEQLQIQLLNSVKVEQFEIDNQLDVDFKPGLYLQTKSFLFNENEESLLSIGQQLINANFYTQILKGNN